MGTFLKFYKSILRKYSTDAMSFMMCRTCLVILSLFLFVLTGIPYAYAVSAENNSSVDTTKPMTLGHCIQAALTTSPYMKVESLSVDMKRIDAENEWYRMFPKINLTMNANVPVGGSADTSSKYSITLTSGSYDPISAYFEHDAQLELISLAKLEKLKTATELIESIAVVFFLKETLEQILAGQSRLEDLAREDLVYSSKMFPDAPTVPLEVKLAEHKLNQILVERDKFTSEYGNHLMRLKRLLGLPGEVKVELDTNGLSQNFFLNFNPNMMTYEHVRINSIYEKMNRSREELAEYGVIAAWADYVPKFSFSVRTPDPINNDSSSDDSYYFTFSASVPIFHWGELGRNVDKAKLKEDWARQYGRIETLKQEDAWYQVRSKVGELKSDVDIAAAEVEMRKMSVRRAEILFNTGNMSYQTLVNEKMALARTEIKHAVSKQLYTIEKLKAFTLSGALLDRFIQVEDDDEITQ